MSHHDTKYDEPGAWFHKSDVPFTATIKGDLEISDGVSYMRAKVEVCDDEDNIWSEFEISTEEGGHEIFAHYLLKMIADNREE